MQIQPGISTINGKPLSSKAATIILITSFVLINILLLAVLGIFAAIDWKSIYLFSNGKTTDGVVVDFKSTGGSEPSSAAVIEFKVNGQTYTVDSSYYDPQPNDLGDHLELIYDPADPLIAQVNTYQERWETLASIFGSICPSLLMIDVVLIFVIVIRMVITPKITEFIKPPTF